MKNKIINILLAILIVSIIATIVLIIIKYGRSQKNEKELKDVVQKYGDPDDYYQE